MWRGVDDQNSKMRGNATPELDLPKELFANGHLVPQEHVPLLKFRVGERLRFGGNSHEMYHLSLREKLGNSSIVTPKIRNAGLQGRTETKDGITYTCRRDVDANRQCPRSPTLMDTLRRTYTFAGGRTSSKTSGALVRLSEAYTE